MVCNAIKGTVYCTDNYSALIETDGTEWLGNNCMFAGNLFEGKNEFDVELKSTNRVIVSAE